MMGLLVLQLLLIELQLLNLDLVLQVVLVLPDVRHRCCDDLTDVLPVASQLSPNVLRATPFQLSSRLCHLLRR
jgi:hypothetical protein